ncbi:MAG: hypothetical protein JXB88_21120, partial [Spirochaetales bacterium]|nr:hypothetical protein [Spirochaetales bacterium]
MIIRSFYLILSEIIYPVFFCLLIVFSCTSVPEIPEDKTVPGDEFLYPEPGITEKIKTNLPPLLTEKIVFYDDFNNTINEWKTGKENNTQFQLQKGYYIINNNHDFDAAFSTIPVTLDYNNNYIIESKIVKIAGKGKCSYGIAWGYDPETGNTHY